MGRRALPKIDPTVDVSRHFFDEKQLEPWTPDVWFGRSAPLAVEVGSGKGLFLRNTAPTRPETNFFGIELAGKYARFAAYRAAKDGIDNVRVARADGVRVMAELIPDESLAEVHVYFPDPWWKARHKKRRVLNPRFLQAVERALAMDGRLHFWTDVKEYYDTTLALIAEITRLDGPLPVPEAQPQHALDYRTHRERRVRLAGEAVYRSEFRKLHKFEFRPLPVETDESDAEDAGDSRDESGADDGES